MAVTDEQLDMLVSYAAAAGEDHRLNQRGRAPYGVVLNKALEQLEQAGERTEDEFGAVITADDLPAPEDHRDIEEAYLKGLFDREAFLDGYIECALWADCQWAEKDQHPSGESGGREGLEPADDTVRETMRREGQIDDFIDANIRDLAMYVELRPVTDAYDPSQGPAESYAGHDFWLTRGGHGAGFWDRGLEELGDRLTEAAQAYGSPDDHTPYDNGDGTFSV